jgi:RNA:NAD 2'-phosphotransferase (TPT1/KptA family)
MNSKTLSYLLRHGARREGLYVDDVGYISLNDIVNWLREKSDVIVSKSDIEEIVKNDAKGRFILNGDLIRAAQGHSFEVGEKAFSEYVGTGPLVHVTHSVNIPSIAKNGLSPMDRRYVHFIDVGQPDDSRSWSLVRRSTDGYVIVGSRELNDARENGIKFLIADNGVVLSPHLPPKYLSCISSVPLTNCYGFFIRHVDKVLTVTTHLGQVGYPKGSREKNEHPLQCGLRELWKETGVMPKDLTFLPKLLEEKNSKNKVSVVYFSATISNEVSVAPQNPYELSKSEWIKVDDLLSIPDCFLRPVRKAMVLPDIENPTFKK